jgi:hypothetical protein
LGCQQAVIGEFPVSLRSRRSIAKIDFSKLDDIFLVFGLGRERLVPAKSKVSFRVSAGFHAVLANAGYCLRRAPGLQRKRPSDCILQLAHTVPQSFVMKLATNSSGLQNDSSAAPWY